MGKSLLAGSQASQVAIQSLRWSADKPSGRAGDSELTFGLAWRLYKAAISDITCCNLTEGSLKAAFGRLEQLSAVQVLKGFDALADAHLLYVAEERAEDFVRSILQQVPAPVRSFVTTMEEGVGDLLSREVVTVKAWRQILSFLLRSDYGFLEGGRWSGQWVDKNAQMRVVKPLSFDIGDLFVRFTGYTPFMADFWGGYFPHHGPGSVAFRDAKGAIVTRRLTVDEKDKLILNHPSFDQRFTSNLPVGSFDSTPSVLLDVPKSWKKRRLIAVESAERMFLQQAIKEGLFNAIAKSSFWSRHIDFSHADKSHPLVKAGSISGRFATIDLEAASDSVSQEVVRQMLRHYPELLDLLWEARSKNILVDESRYTINGFATMGNATTFPIESLVFGCCCLEAIRRNDDDPSYSHFRVYGDDITIETKYAPVLVSVLEECGFTVNRSKSFLSANSRFRESCGLECYRGVEITPFRLPRGWKYLHPRKCNLLEISSWIDVANRAFLSGMWKVSSLLKHEVLHEGRWAIPLWDALENPDGVGFAHWDNGVSHLPTAYNLDCQCWSVAYQGLRGLTATRENNLLALYEWLGRTRDRSAEQPLVSSSSHDGSRFKDEASFGQSKQNCVQTSRVSTGTTEHTIYSLNLS